ncbi:MAG TPA: mechanosensitive ion channel domain-containing protein [Candidatus Dormibacteraeota bacterium]|nr:mechanosensitive ion channel domain-containing protein [Candidatus Dormibacteraeota bacterium]
MIAAATSGITVPDTTTLVFVVVGFVVLVVFVIGSRLVAKFTGDQLQKRHFRVEVIVISRRVVTVVVIAIGIFLAFGFALKNSDVPLLGILVATVVAALGVQDLLKDYVSGYYILLERHIRVGDHITFDGHDGVVSEVRLRVTLLRSDDGQLVVVPNSELFSKAVTIKTTPPA